LWSRQTLHSSRAYQICGQSECGFLLVWSPPESISGVSPDRVNAELRTLRKVRFSTLRSETVEILEWPALQLIFGLSKARRRSIPFDGSVTEEQRRSGQKAAEPFGRKRFEASGCVARSFQVATDLRLARALPSTPTCFRAGPSQYFNSLLR
jgi:hypothetical protein